MALTKVHYTDNETVIGAKNLNDIQDEIIANGNNINFLNTGKVDKVAGKGLSTLDFTVADRQAISNAYVKPTAGVPKTDLSQDVQTSLDKADNSLQAALDETLTVQGAAADAKATGDAVGELKSAFINDFEINNIPTNVAVLPISISSDVISNAASKGVTVTPLEYNKFRLNGTATGDFYLTFGQGTGVTLPSNKTVYFYIKSTDNEILQTGIQLNITYTDSSGTAHSTSDTIKQFNEPVQYVYDSSANLMNNYFYVLSGATFDNVVFEYNVSFERPINGKLLNEIEDLTFTDSYTRVPLTWESATGYWSSQGFSTYSDIYTATVDVVQAEKYRISARSFYGMLIGVYYKGDTVRDNIVGYIFLSNDYAWHYNYETTVPVGAQHLLIQQYGTSRATLLKVTENNIKKSALSNKFIAYNGDSICESRYSGVAANGGGYAQLIQAETGCFFQNRAISGGILASAVPSGDNPARFVVSDVTNMVAEADLVCFEGGLNDFFRNVPLGTFDANDYTSTVDTTTVCGALESIFRQAVVRWLGKPICFIIVHRCIATTSANRAGYTFAQMREKMIGICEKYAIPYYDAYTKSGLNAYNPGQSDEFLDAGSSGEPDGMHPNEAAYKKYYVPQLISLFESILPMT